MVKSPPTAPASAPCAERGPRRLEPRASVIVVNYNGGSRLARCLGSLALGCGEADEVILVDNASTDGSVEGVEQAFPGVTVVRNAVNRGFGAGNNLGARLASGRYLVFLNPDTTVEPGWLEALVAALDADPTIGLATARILMLDAPGQINTCGNDVHCSGLTLCRGAGLSRDALPDPAEVGAVSGAAFAIRRELFERLGGFDEEFFLYVEDTDLSWRARLAGYRCVYVPASVVYHDYALRFGPRKTYYLERNRYLMLLKSLRWRTLLAMLPTLLLAEVVTWGFALLLDWRRLGPRRSPSASDLANKVRAYAWLARHWPAVLERRRQTQALRRIGDRALLAACTDRLAFEQTGRGLAQRLARALFDPAFHALHRLTLAVTRW